MAAARVVVLGSANVDFVVRLARRPEPGETVLAREHRVVAGGKGANQAVAAARAGAEVAFVGRVGDDAYGADVLAGLAAAGIDVTHLEIQRGAVTGAAFITVTPDGENAIVVSAGANGALDPDAVDAAREAIGAAAVLAVQLEVPLSAVEHACRLAGEAGTQVVLSAAPAIPAACRLVPLADILVCNLGEVRLLADAPSAEPSVAARALLRLGAERVVVTLGPEGAIIVEHGGETSVPAYRAGVVADTTAAGDALAGVLAARLAAGDEPAQALELAVVAAGIAVTRLGAQPSLPTLAEIQAAG